MAATQTKVFLSYSHVDAAFANWLMQELQARRINVWLDKEGIRAGKHWPREIVQALSDCSHLLIILSPSSVSSREVLNELYWASDSGKQILPILYYSCDIPSLISSIHYVDFTNLNDYEQALEKIVQRFHETRHLEPARKRIVTTPSYSGDRGLALSNDRWLAGVCGGLADAWGMSPLVVRIIFLVVTFFTSGFTVILYPILWLIMRRNSS